MFCTSDDGCVSLLVWENLYECIILVICSILCMDEDSEVFCNSLSLPWISCHRCDRLDDETIPFASSDEFIGLELITPLFRKSDLTSIEHIESVVYRSHIHEMSEFHLFYQNNERIKIIRNIPAVLLRSDIHSRGFVVAKLSLFSIYLPDFVRLQFRQSIWQFSAVVFPPSCHGVILLVEKLIVFTLEGNYYRGIKNEL